MSVTNPIRLPDPTPGQLTDTRGDGTRLLAAVLFLGGFHHLMFLRATDTPCDADGEEVDSTEDPEYNHTEWRTDHTEDQEDLENLRNLYEARFEVVTVPGYPGQYITYMTPHGQ